MKGMAMKLLIPVMLCAALAGCATADGRLANSAPRDPSQWRVVSVTPVPAGTAARVAAKSADGKAVEYSSSPAPFYNPAPPYQRSPVYATAPVYGQVPVYGPAPVYTPQPYYYPPISLSLGFVFGRHWSRGHMRGGWRR